MRSRRSSIRARCVSAAAPRRQRADADAGDCGNHHRWGGHTGPPRFKGAAVSSSEVRSLKSEVGKPERFTLSDFRLQTSNLIVVLSASGLTGFLVGLAFDEWQVVVETAQVLAGIVSYPHDNPFFIYHVKVWSILHQVCAALLRAGVSEAALSVAISGLLGMLSFQALALVIFAIGHDALTAVGGMFILFITRAAEYGVIYPIWLVGTIHTYGLFGLAWCVASLGLLGLGRTKAGALMLGMAPAVHPSIGVWFGAIAMIAVAWGRRDLGTELRRGVAGFAIGAAVTLVSLVIRLVLTPPIASGDPAFTRDVLTAFITFWDGHRRPVDFSAEGLWLNVGALALGVVWLTRFRGHLTPAARLLLRFVVVAAVGGVAIALVSQIPIDRLPVWFVILMPSRLLNLNAMVFAALLFGILSLYRRTWPAQEGLRRYSPWGCSAPGGRWMLDGCRTSRTSSS